MTVKTRSGSDALKKQELRAPLLQTLNERSIELQGFWSCKPEVMTNKVDRHGIGDACWIENLKECPVYYPTKQDFIEDPLSYIQKIAVEASKYGICKIVSPVVATVPAGVVLSKEQSGFRFATRLQPMRISNWDKDDKIAFPIKGRNYTLTEYEKVANRVFSRKFSTAAGLPPMFIESVFWKELVGGKTRTVEYATDVDGSAFSTSKTDPLGQSKWNLKGISRLPDSTLRLLEEAIPGVTEPMLYFGMLFSMFAWHVEDHYLYSINYQHCGAPKTWYGVPGDAALHFEKVVKEHVYSRELLNDTGKGAELDLLLEKTTMFAPKLLIDHGVPVFKAVQYPGEFIITFPRAYHAGFSHGFNCGEAVNFAMADWFPFGAEAGLRYEFLNRLPILPQDELLCKEATIIDSKYQIGHKDSLCKQHACVMMAFVALMRCHQQVKSALELQGAKTTTLTPVNVSCGLCKHKCYVGYTHCKCFPEPTCFNHGGFFSSCSCEGDRVISLRHDFSNLQLVAQTYEREEERRKQAEKLFLDDDTAKHSDGSPSRGASECFESSLLTNAMSSREACDKQEDREDACSENVDFILETSGILPMSNCRQAQEEEVEEEESDREVLKIKRRRVASPQSKRFQVDEQEIDKSLVRSPDFGISFNRQEHTALDKQGHAKCTSIMQRGFISVRQVIDELNIRGSAAEIMSQWQSDARRQGLNLKVKEATVGQENLKVLSLKSLSCLKDLVSKEESKVLQRLMWKMKSRRNGGGCRSLGESSNERSDSLRVIPIIRHPRVTTTTEDSLLPGELHPVSDKKPSAENEGLSSLAGSSSILSADTALHRVQGGKFGGVSIEDEDAPDVSAVGALYPGSGIEDVCCDPELTRVEGGLVREECSSSEPVSMEPESSAPLTQLVAKSPSAAINAEEREGSSLQTIVSSPAAELETCKSVGSHIENGVQQGMALADEGRICHMEEFCIQCDKSWEALRTENMLPDAPAEAQKLVDIELSRERDFETVSGANAALSSHDYGEIGTTGTSSSVPHIESGVQQCTALADEGSISHMEEVCIQCDKSSEMLGTENTIPDAPAEAQQLVDIELSRVRDFETGSPANARESSHDCGEHGTTSMSSVPKKGLVIYLNQNVKQSQEKAAKFSHDQKKIENDYDQVEIFEGQSTGNAWCLDEGMTSFCSDQNEGESVSPLEQLPSMCGDDFLHCHLDHNGAQESVDVQFGMKADRPSRGGLSVVGHQHGKSVCSHVGSEAPIGEVSHDVIKLCSHSKNNSCPVSSQQVLSEKDHKSGRPDSVELPSRREVVLPADSGKQQKVELVCKKQEFPAGLWNCSEISDAGIDAHDPRFRNRSCLRETSGFNVVDKRSYNSQSHGGFKTDTFVGRGANWGCSQQGRYYDSSSHHPTGQRISRNDSGKFKRITRRPLPYLNQESHPYRRDTYSSINYPGSFHERQAPFGYWKRRANRHYNDCWRDTKTNNAFGRDRHQIKGVVDREAAGCSSSAFKGAGYVEGYDPVKWEITPSANCWRLPSTDHHLHSSCVDRGFPRGL